MTSSTTRAFVAKKPFATASAFMAKTNQLLSTMASLRLLLVMFLTLTVSAKVWGADYSKNESWNFGKTGNTNWSGHNSDYCGACGSKNVFNVYKTNITNFSNIDFSKYENVSLTIYVKAGTNSGTNSYTVKLIDANGNQVSTYTSTKTNGMGNGTNSSSAKESSVSFNPTTSFNGYKIEFPAKAYITQTRYVLTYDDKVAAHTVTWTINPAAGGTLSATSGNSTTVSPNAAYTYGASAYTVTSGEATVSQSGNTFTATPTANSTIQINMVEKTPATISFENMGNPTPTTTGYYVGDTYTLPATNDYTCGDKTFVGWSTEIIENSPTKPTAATYFEPGASVTLAANQTFYAVIATKGSNQTATFDAATISGLTKSSSSLTWTHNNSGIALYLSAGQRYTNGTPNTFTVTQGTSNYCQLSAPVGVIMSEVVATLSGTNYKINSVSTPWTLSTSSTTQTISSTSGSDYLKMSATSSNQIRITKLVVTYTTYSDYTTQCSNKPSR